VTIPLGKNCSNFKTLETSGDYLLDQRNAFQRNEFSSFMNFLMRNREEPARQTKEYFNKMILDLSK
jgi:hypothetical protein